MWYFTSPAESTAAFLPSNSANSVAGLLAQGVHQHVEAAAVGHADDHFLHADRAGVRTSWSIARISDSPPSSEKRFWPT
jgi:hypothetical protein